MRALKAVCQVGEELLGNLLALQTEILLSDALVVFVAAIAVHVVASAVVADGECTGFVVDCHVGNLVVSLWVDWLIDLCRSLDLCRFYCHGFCQCGCSYRRRRRRSRIHRYYRWIFRDCSCCAKSQVNECDDRNETNEMKN